MTQSGVALTACGHYSDFGQRGSIVSMARGSFALLYGYGRANDSLVPISLTRFLSQRMVWCLCRVHSAIARIG